MNTQFTPALPPRLATALASLVAFAAGALTAAAVLGQAPAISQPWWAIGGGGTSAGGTYELRGAIAANDGDWLSGGPYSLAGAPAAVGRETAVYLPRLSNAE